MTCSEVALAQAQQASEQAPELYTSIWTLVELIEAASRTGQIGLVADTLRLAEATSAGQADWGRGSTPAAALLCEGRNARRGLDVAAQFRRDQLE